MNYITELLFIKNKVYPVFLLKEMHKKAYKLALYICVLSYYDSRR